MTPHWSIDTYLRERANMSETKRTSAQTQERIHAEARRLFNLKGYVGMTLREIAAGVGIEAQSLYNYTRSKQDLVASLMGEGTTAIQGAVDKALAASAATPSARLWAATSAHTLHYCSSDQVVLVREGLVHLDAERRSEVLGQLKTYENTFKDILRAGVTSGEFRTVDITPTAFAILGMGESVINWFRPSRRLAATDVATYYADLALRSVQTDSTAEPDEH